MGGLTTHVLDTASGRPAAGVRIELFRLPDADTPLASVRTNADGRCDGPLLEGADFQPGEYQLVFQAGEYFDARDGAGQALRFLDQVVIRFGVSNAAEHYHVPLLLAPYGYSTYRGS
jgi:5-hydroxyisourate hydrolase